MARSNLPCEVASVIAVVRVRVSKRMLPPTMSAAPTSDSTRPNATTTAAASAKRASRATAQPVRSVPAPRVSAVRRTLGSTVWTAAALSAVAIGSARITSATTMACPVNSRPRPPSGPLRMNRR